MPKAFSPQDHYFHLAKKRKLRARSAFKLEEILKKYPHLLPKHGRILDLGSAPGSFLQILQEHASPRSLVIGVDLQKIEKFSNFQHSFHLIQGDVFSKKVSDKIQDILKEEKIDLITADLAPKTSGIKDIDQWKSVELNQQVFQICKKFLTLGGNLITKIFVGEDFQEFWKDEFQLLFQKSKIHKPKACRDRSFETYLIGEKFLKQ